MTEPTPCLFDPSLIDRLIDELYHNGWFVGENFLGELQRNLLLQRAQGISDYAAAGIGRGGDHHRDLSIRRDQIHWLDPGQEADNLWLELMESLRVAINQHLFLGLFEYECHFAYYPPGAFYRRHYDAFKGAGSRIVTTVLYLNAEWQRDWGGELKLYGRSDELLCEIPPCGGTLVMFLSEEFPHEVLPTTRDRYSLSGWFRLNGSSSLVPDPLV